ncbi:hypothetical protein PGT21_005321 [Puccinia graminis f. sp. tritici]|uniref:Uncharacterized protein n=1 Tax=Puccinia graminis f. sp. tritici TaxID=56615 RepID=A0A5B0P1Q9_PUCGR|nr:hypothetical protein PGT21_005321 [Puccinia graminis f. sp. tritici]
MSARKPKSFWRSALASKQLSPPKSRRPSPLKRLSHASRGLSLTACEYLYSSSART